MPNSIKCIISNEAPCINDLIDINEITHNINQYIERIRPTINIKSLNGWGILISAIIRNTDKIGFYKRTTRYPSDNESLPPVLMTHHMASPKGARLLPSCR
ncbi:MULTISPECIES: Imm9 family immunity protein [Pseudomonas putida group]|uniref:Imm9 family immunity protein n=1 Tax=Pseudomonas putida group TaxID=136845 RepID=UPI003461BD80